MHGQEVERSGEARQSLETGCPRSDIWPSSQIEAAFLGESDVTHAKNVSKCRDGAAKEPPRLQVAIQRQHCRFGSFMSKRGDGRMDVQREQFLAIQLRSIAAKDGREESIHVPIEPFPHSLSCD